MPGLIDTLAAGEPIAPRLVNARTGGEIAAHVDAAFDSESRRRGLFGREVFREGEALVIAPCEAVHTWFMKWPIDLAFVTREGKVLSTHSGLRPWRMAMSMRAFAAIELPDGTVVRTGIQPGDTIGVRTTR